MPVPRRERIVLIGFMATGKSAVGKLLAKKLGWKHLDCDALVERSRGMSVRRIFEAKGEAVFRSAESAALARALSGKRTVVSTGGGIVLSERNRALIRARGAVIWLRSPVREVLGRVKSGTRPLLNVADPRAVAAKLLKQRAPLYRACAHVSVRSGDEPLGRIADRVLKRLGFRIAELKKGKKIDR